MALTKPVPSPETKQALLAGIESLVDPAGIFRDVTPDYHPLQVHVLGLRDLVQGAGIGAARMVAWRFLAGGPSGHAVAGDVSSSEATGALAMTSLSHGPIVAQALQSAREAETLPQVQAGNYELRTLSIPGIVDAMWLRSQPDGIDLVVPYLTLCEQLSKPVYPMDQFLNIVRSLAAKRLEFDDRPQPANVPP